MKANLVIDEDLERLNEEVKHLFNTYNKETDIPVMANADMPIKTIYVSTTCAYAETPKKRE